MALPCGGGGRHAGVSGARISRRARGAGNRKSTARERQLGQRGGAGGSGAATRMTLHASDSLDSVAALVVPVPPAAAPSAQTRLYTVRKGDTLVTIADRFGVSLNQLRRWNKVTGIKVEPGRRLRVAEPVVLRTPSSGHRRKTSAASSTTAKTNSSTA